MEFLQRLDKYDSHEIAEIALNASLFSEAFFIYKKIGENLKAIQVLLYHMKDLDKAAEFAEKVKQPEVYTELAKAQLENDRVKESIGIKQSLLNNHNNNNNFVLFSTMSHSVNERVVVVFFFV
jgi:clathrin heavy chain